MAEASDYDRLIFEITPDVMCCLKDRRYFEKLDDILCPSDNSIPVRKCTGTFAISETILSAEGFDDDARADIYSVLRSKGGFCDCETLFNVAEGSRMASNYWRQQAAEYIGHKISRAHKRHI